MTFLLGPLESFAGWALQGISFWNLLSILGTVILGAFAALVQLAIQMTFWIFSLLPHLPLWPGGDASYAVSLAMSNLVYGLNTWNYYVAINLALILAYTFLLLESFLVVVRGLKFALSYLPLIGGRGNSGVP